MLNAIATGSQKSDSIEENEILPSPQIVQPTKDLEKKGADEDTQLTLDKRVLFHLDAIGEELAKKRGRPLLLMFYSNNAGQIEPADLEYLESIFSSIEGKINELDLIIYTRGGDVSTSYRIAQLIHRHCDELTTIVPLYSYSGGTLIALSSDKILMREGISCISPIDVQLSDSRRSVPLINFNQFIEFLNETTDTFELKPEEKARYLSALMQQLMGMIHPLEIGEFYRMKSLQERYAKVLLREYMFRYDSNKEEIAQTLIQRLTSECPTHRFDIDYQIALDFGLKVETMDDETYALGKELIRTCVKNKRMGIICPYVDVKNNVRMPFFKLYGIMADGDTGAQPETRS